jgi:aspartate-semialdehyde dehydrogenase
MSATAIRVPVYRAHAEAIHAAFERPVTVEAAREVLAVAPGVELVDDRTGNVFPTPRAASGRDAVLVGRLREDVSLPGGLAWFLAGDQIRKGAALNAVQIAEHLTAAR